VDRVARPEGLEPPAYWFEANRSIQLSYGRGSGDRDLMVSKEGIQKSEFRSQNSEVRMKELAVILILLLDSDFY
jgi:hypothetical protein